MLNILNVLLILSISLFIYAICSNEEKLYNHTLLEQNLYFVFSTFRHGARATFSKIDYFGNNISNPGSLTKYGAIQHLEIGKKYRQRYSNFLNMSFDKNQLYIRSSDEWRTIISTLKELEGLFSKVIERSNIHIIQNGMNYWNLFQLNDSEHKELSRYFQYCNKKRFLPDYGNILKNDIFPFLKECYGKSVVPNPGHFCDAVFAAYFEYTYGNDTKNQIGKCGKDKADKMNKYCFDFYNTFRGWNENAAYMFYMLFQNIITHMRNFINGKSDLRMMMIGGHDITVDKLMNFLDGLKLIPRSTFPHYAFNIVIELRKYNDEFYLEFYYNDTLKYNETLATFDNILKNSKFSDLYNFCGLPPWINDSIKETQQIKTENIQDIPFTQISEDKKGKEIIDIALKTEDENNLTHYIKDISDEKISSTNKVQEKYNEPNSSTQKLEERKNGDFQSKGKIITTEYILESSELEDSVKIKIIEKTDFTQNLKEGNETIFFNDSHIISDDTPKSIKLNSTNSEKFKEKLKKIFNQDNDLNLYIILFSIIVSIIIILIIILIICFSKRQRKFIMLYEEKSKNKGKNNNNISVISIDIRKDEKNNKF